MARYFISSCKNPDCSVCHPKEPKMSAINHRLFGNNNSTATHWYPSRGGSIPINELSWNHLAAIVDLYEGEAVKFIHENFRPFLISSSDPFKRNSVSVQSFLKKHVKAWPRIKERERELFRINRNLWAKLFRDKQYNVEVPKSRYSEENLIGRQIEIIFDSESLLRKKQIEEFEKARAVVNLKVVQIKLQIADLEELISKIPSPK